jgi:hypothetical protein
MMDAQYVGERYMVKIDTKLDIESIIILKEHYRKLLDKPKNTIYWNHEIKDFEYEKDYYKRQYEKYRQLLMKLLDI